MPRAFALPDPDDLPFLEVATEANALLITGNAAHYPPGLCGAVRVYAPGEFIRQWRQ